MKPPLALDGRAAELRRAFDDSFAILPSFDAEPTIDLLGVVVAGEAFALRVADVSAVLKPKKIVPVPSRRASLLGLAGIRGNLAAVYGLATLLGRSRTAGPPRWIAVARASDSVALAFDEVSGFLRTRVADLLPAPAGAPHVSRIVRAGETSRSIVDLDDVVRFLQPEAAPRGQPKE
jgi:purine-binding chemotaxis protein CheW